MSQELKPCESCAAPKHQQYPQRNGDSICAACGATYGLAAAPVPPAGGEVEVLAWRVLGYNFNTEALALDYAKWAEDVEPVRYLVDRAHVTRLQAENAALQQRLNTADQRVDELEALMARVSDHLNFWHDHPYAECLHGVIGDYKKLSPIANQCTSVAKDE